ncbi:hypothetical protein O4220_12740 [Rhodococcus ruber]|uniref:ABC transporter permease n=1 Tax=Rhodococcus ruber TaxID=1830 RepID=A0ABT4MEG7_9NOCA|nr:hypothetical protein [Rhodococcus ruber]MCZ4519383.1 hypothetical protein [Rhodococcus ruber]
MTDQLAAGVQDARSRKKPSPTVMMLGGMVVPLFLMTLLPLLYTWGLHSPTPHDMDVRIVGTSTQVEQFAQQVQAQVGSSFDVGVVADVDAAKDAVSSLETRGAYDPATNIVYVASEGNLAAAQAVEGLFGSIAGKTVGTAPTVFDVAPTSSTDRLGASLMFVGLAAILGGFLTATVLQLLLPGLSLRVELTVIAVMSVVSAVVPAFVAYGVYGAVSGSILEVLVLLALSAFVVGSFHLGGMRLIGPGMMIPTLLIMVLLGVPSSGAAIAPEMVPGFFTTLNSFLPTPALLEGLKRLVYFPAASIGGTVAVMAMWGFLAAGLLGLSVLRHKKDPDEPILSSFAAIPAPENGDSK